MFKYKVVAIMSANELMRRGGNKRQDIVEGELPDEIVGMALDEFSKKGWRLHSILPLNTDMRRGNSGYLAIFEMET